MQNNIPPRKTQLSGTITSLYDAATLRKKLEIYHASICYET